MHTNKLVVIPTFNEAENIVKLVEQISANCPQIDILIVDDNSPDGTGKIADKLAGSNTRIKCLHRLKKQGIGRAYIEAFKWALTRNYDYIAQMDADFSHDPEYLPQIFRLMNEYDLVIGSRYVKGGKTENWGRVRQFVSRFGCLYAQLILDLSINDLTGGFKCFRKSILEKIGIDTISTRGYAFQIETTFRAYKNSARIKEFPITFSDRRVGRTKMTWNIFFEAVFAVLKLKFNQVKI